jgi:hypothetical protein
MVRHCLVRLDTRGREAILEAVAFDKEFALVLALVIRLGFFANDGARAVRIAFDDDIGYEGFDLLNALEELLLVLGDLGGSLLSGIGVGDFDAD